MNKLPITSLTKKFLQEEYLIKKKSLFQIQKETGINRKLVRQRLKKFGIKVRGKQQSLELRANRQEESNKPIEKFEDVYVTICKTLMDKNISSVFTKKFCKLYIPSKKMCVFINEKPSDNIPIGHVILEIDAIDFKNKIRKIANKIENCLTENEDITYFYFEV